MTDQWIGMLRGQYYADAAEAEEQPAEDLVAMYSKLLEQHSFVVVTYYRGIW